MSANGKTVSGRRKVRKSDPSRALHPWFDELSTGEWDQFNLRHAELHMSFVHPAK